MARVKYLNSTLREVVFQIRFPKILKLTEETPAAFQEIIMKDYPIYNVQKNETVLEINGQHRQQANDINHSFISKTGKTKVNLTSSFVAVSTLEYDRWEALKKEIDSVLQKFYQCYTIPGIQRIGLRYKNYISRKNLGLGERPWSELLNSSVLGPLSIRDDIKKYKTEFELKNGEECFTNRLYELVREFPNPELMLLLDCDYYYTGFYKTEDLSQLSENLHDLSQKFIEESHKEDLLKAMHPQELEPWPAI